MSRRSFDAQRNDAGRAAFWLALSAINGFMAVATGAFAAHGLRAMPGSEALGWIVTAATHQMWHALGLLGVAAMLEGGACRQPVLVLAGWCFLVGIVIFAGSLYLMAWTGWRGMGWLTPLGGTAAPDRMARACLARRRVPRNR